MLPSEFLDHLRGLLPDINAIYEVALLDALPPNARDAALQHTGMDAMATAADLVVLGNRALAAAQPVINAVSIPHLEDSFDDGPPAVAAVARTSRPPLRKTDTLCAIHARYGKEAYKCQSPNSCKMRHVVRPRPPPSTAPGNGPAGGRQ